MKSPTIFEISKILKLSPSTVSRALKNHPDIAPATKERILELARKMDYEPNLFAVGLRKNRSREIGIVVPTLTGFFYDSFIAAVEEEARKSNYSLVIMLSGDDPEVEFQNVKMCKMRRVDGIMVCVTSRTFDVSYFEKLQSANVPLLFFDKVPQMEKANTVCLADAKAAELAAEALMAKGKKNILSIFADVNFSITRNRVKAYQEAFATAGRSNHITIAHALSSGDAEKIVTEACKQTRPDAIFSMSDEILTGVMKALQLLQLVDAVSVISISNGFFPKLYHPEITYVETSGSKLGKRSFERMIQMIEGNTSYETLMVDSVLVPGQSL